MKIVMVLRESEEKTEIRVKSEELINSPKFKEVLKKDRAKEIE